MVQSVFLAVYMCGKEGRLNLCKIGGGGGGSVNEEGVE